MQTLDKIGKRTHREPVLCWRLIDYNYYTLVHANSIIRFVYRRLGGA